MKTRKDTLKKQLTKELEYYVNRVEIIGAPETKQQKAALTRAKNCLNIRRRKLVALEHNDLPNWTKY